MGNNSTDDLTYEDYAVEDYAGGTGTGYGYDYEDSSELTDIDYQPNDESSQYTGTGTGTEAFDPVARNDDGENQGDSNDATSGYSRFGTSVDEEYTDDYEEEIEDNFDGEEDDVEDDDEDGDEEEGDEIEQNQGGEETGDKQSSNKVKKKKPDGPIKWKKGDEVTLPLLYQVWKECHSIEEVQPMIDSANKAVMEVISSLGPNLVLKLNNYITKTANNRLDTIGCLLDLASRKTKRLTYVALSVLEAIFDQQWTQTTILATLPTILETAIKTNPLKGILNAIFMVAVPLINKKLNAEK